MKKITEEYNKEIAEHKTELIKYELSNHECYYTYELDEVINLLKDIATEDEILKVFQEEKKNHLDD
jgi:hypothetical protein